MFGARRDISLEVVAALDDDKISAAVASTIAALPKEKQRRRSPRNLRSRFSKQERVEKPGNPSRLNPNAF
jgi:hypothetical protein